MAGIRLDVAHFAGLLIAIWMYGIFLCMFFASIRPLWNRRHRTKFVLVVTVGLLITSSANAGVFIGYGYSAFITNRASPGVIEYYNGWSVYQPISNFCLAAAVVNADVLLIFRLFMIWSQNRRVVVVPSFLVLVECIAAIILCVMSAVPSESAYSSHHSLHELAVILSGVCTVFVNVICTPMIVGRLWWIGKRGHARDTRSLYSIVIMRLIESGSLYTVTLLVWVVFQVMPNTGIGSFTNYIFVMIIAIAPMLIVLHLNQSTASEMRVVEMNTHTQRCSEGQRGDGETPHRSVGIVSTTIAFKQPTHSGQLDSLTTQNSEKRSEMWNRHEADEGRELEGKCEVLDDFPGREENDLKEFGPAVSELSSAETGHRR
ncbi:hypothetical protein FRB97_001953 [Tulasnella sp. 331]|nr:hypothetical protein FRB97_001953 [Tulasnella sp. 331]